MNVKTVEMQEKPRSKPRLPPIAARKFPAS